MDADMLMFLSRSVNVCNKDLGYFAESGIFAIFAAKYTHHEYDNW